MTTDGRENGGQQAQAQAQAQVRVRGGDGEPARPGVDEMKASFQGQSDPGLARQRSQQARSARGALMVVGALVALVCLVVILGRFTSGAPTGVGTAVYVLSLLSAVGSVELARRARTRWAMMAVIFAAAGASLADALP
ncbi:hypothetical protein ABZ499_34065 [Streptomyces sp. NPDC019990]|uniref:hypothetical protein n=1 Tax=Streptomyces sp. NPDC019990 TaxID=3154693 RepID=UPI0033C7369B